MPSSGPKNQTISASRTAPAAVLIQRLRISLAP